MTKADKSQVAEAGIAHASPETLRRGWTTGACATAALKSALHGLIHGATLDPVSITLPKGQTPSFCLNVEDRQDGWVLCGIKKDAGDDPDVTHGATIQVKVSWGSADQGIRFIAGQGVGTATRAGLPIEVGQPSITPTPRAMMTEVATQLCQQAGCQPDLDIEVSIPGGEAMAEQTLNPRLGVVGGLSILGTTGIVIPYSCSSWIHSIHRGIDVAKAAGIETIAASTGDTSEKAIKALLSLPEPALIDMGDFAGGTLKYLRDHPVSKLVLAGGFGKLSKLAMGHMDLHSSRSQVDVDWLIAQAAKIDNDFAKALANKDISSAAEFLLALNDKQAMRAQVLRSIAESCRHQAQHVIGSQTAVEIYMFDRRGNLLN